MRALAFLLLVSTAACAGSQVHDLTPDTSDPSWQPPGQGDLAIGADPEPKAAKPKKARHLKEPNHREIQKLRAGNP